MIRGRWIWVCLTLGLAIAIATVIVMANLGRLPSELGNIPHGDKAGHLILMGGLAFLIEMSLGARRVRWGAWAFPIGSVGVMAACLIEECSQVFLPTRTFDLMDLAFDLLGIGLGAWLAASLCRRIPTSTSTSDPVDLAMTEPVPPS